MVAWIWLGGVVLTLGALLALWPARRRVVEAEAEEAPAAPRRGGREPAAAPALAGQRSGR
jgi:hypothetical protein